MPFRSVNPTTSRQELRARRDRAMANIALPFVCSLRVVFGRQDCSAVLSRIVRWLNAAGRITMDGAAFRHQVAINDALVLMCRQASSAMASACASFAPNMLMNHTRITNEAGN